MKKQEIHEIVGLAEPCPVTRRHNMRILCDLQLSNKMPGQSRFLFSKDSNVVYFSTMMRAIHKLRPDWGVHVLVPLPEQMMSDKGERYTKDDTIERVRENFRGLEDVKTLHLLPYRYVSEAFTQRFNFNIRGMAPFLKSLTHEYDFIWCNEPAHVQNWNMTMFGRRMGDAVPIGSFCHWVTGWTDRKAPSDRLDWMIRHGEGLFASVFTLLTSKTAASLFVEGLRQYFNRDFIEKVIPKIGVLAVPTDSSNFMAKKHLGSRSNEGPLRLLWAHRLNNYTGFDSCFEALLPLHEKRPGLFTLWVPDPGNRETQENLHKKYPFIEPLDKSSWTFDEYVKLCWSAHVALGNHNGLSVWGGLALSEPQICGCFALAPGTSWYREQIGTQDEKNINFFKWKDKKALASAVEALIDAPREWVIRQGEQQAKFALESFDMDVYANRLVSFIESVVYPKRDEKWVRYICEAARAGHLNSESVLGLGELYEKMAEWGKMGNLVDPVTGRTNGFPHERKNFWTSVRRRLLDAEILIDDTTHPVCSYKVGPRVNEEIPEAPWFSEHPSWKTGSEAPWLHRDTLDVKVGLKEEGGLIHPTYSLVTEEAVNDKDLDKADLPEVFEEDVDVTDVVMMMNRDGVKTKKKKKAVEGLPEETTESVSPVETPEPVTEQIIVETPVEQAVSGPEPEKPKRCPVV